MVKEYDEVIQIVQSKLSTIGFYLEENNEFDATFGNGTNWKITLEGERYVRPAYDIFVKKIDDDDKEIVKNGFCVRMLFGVLGLKNNLPIEADLDLFIENKDKIFDETFPYKEAYDKLRIYK